MSVSYPADSIQSAFELLGNAKWWETTGDSVLRPGRLVWAFVPHVVENPTTLVVEGRGSDASNHDEARFRLVHLDVRNAPPRPRLPVAALPLMEGATYLVSTAKKRPCILLSISPQVDKQVTLGAAGWQFSRTLSVVPGYGVEQTAMRVGWPEAFMARVRTGEYPAYHWDTWPTSSLPGGTIFRLDQIATVGAGSRSVETSNLCLSSEALAIVRQRLDWLATGTIEAGSALEVIRDLLQT